MVWAPCQPFLHRLHLINLTCAKAVYITNGLVLPGEIQLIKAATVVPSIMSRLILPLCNGAQCLFSSQGLSP